MQEKKKKKKKEDVLSNKYLKSIIDKLLYMQFVLQNYSLNFYIQYYLVNIVQ